MWYYSQGEQLQKIFDVLQDERVYSPFIRSKNHKFLLDQYQSLFPLSKWRPSVLDEASIYSTIGDIYYDLGQKKDAQKSYIDGLAIFRQGKKRGWEAEMLNKL